ncbi:MAG TPA: XdhC/CoxI family protein [Euzebyales bacterium]|nr:XdhC/CoxI family protein [Euzebyales bacterium]
MRDILSVLQAWWKAEEPLALATVVDVRKSAPRQPGTAMAISLDGEVAGSVSGGCVEGAVYQLGRQVLGSSKPELAHYGYSDDEAFAVGLTCGGELDVFVERIDHQARPWFGRLLDAIEEESPVAIATVIDAPSEEDVPPRRGATMLIGPGWTEGSVETEGLQIAVVDDARGMLQQGRTAERRYGRHGERRLDDVRVFISSFAPRPRMFVFGAIDYAAAVARVGSFLGYHVTVCDARATFATSKRFPDADEVIVEWPHRYLERVAIDERTAICVLTHDPKFDVPLLEVALRSPASYIGAMGSRRTHDERLERLRERGVDEAELARLRSPIGLDLGARTPEETAVSVAAELIQCRWGGSGRPLTDTSGRIHEVRGAAVDEAAGAGT